ARLAARRLRGRDAPDLAAPARRYGARGRRRRVPGPGGPGADPDCRRRADRADAAGDAGGVPRRDGEAAVRSGGADRAGLPVPLLPDRPWLAEPARAVPAVGTPCAAGARG